MFCCNREQRNGVVGSGESGIRRDTDRSFFCKWEKLQHIDGRVTEEIEEMIQEKQNKELLVQCR